MRIMEVVRRKMNCLNQFGQEFSVFRMLIAFVMGVAILLIILTAVEQFDEYKYSISKKRMYEGFHSAVQSPNGDVIVRDDLRFRIGDMLTAGGFASQESLDPGCVVSVNAPETTSTTNPNSSSVKFLQSISTELFFRCIRSSSPPCRVQCEISVKEPFP